MKPRRKQSSSSQLRPLILIAIGLILIIAALFWFIRSAGQPPQVELARPTLTNDPNGPYPNIPRVGLEDAKMALDGQAAVFLDVRSADAYGAGHIPGAINIPLAELAGRAGELNAQDWIITYCT